MSVTERSQELAHKLSAVRTGLAEHGLAAVRLRGADWFSWATCGGSSVVDGSSETGVAEVVVSVDRAFILADRVDAARIGDEERPTGLDLVEVPWADAAAREAVVTDAAENGRIASDRPAAGELPLPSSVVAARRQLLPAELERYRAVSRESAAAATRVLASATPDMSEADLAAAASAELLRHGIAPVVVLVGGERRLPRYRHPTPTTDSRLGERAMLVLCARRHGLIANLTRFVYFREPTAEERRLNELVAQVEAAALDASRAGARLAQAYEAIVGAYRNIGFPGAELDHHQGGPCGYRTREEIATSASRSVILDRSALAWNPSLPGAKIEDTVVVDGDSVEILTVDPAWPTTGVARRLRPDLLVRA